MAQYKIIETIYRVAANEKLAAKTWRMRLKGDTSLLSAPGQFVNLQLDGKYLRRPISISSWKDGELTLLYDVVGAGTAAMSTMPEGTEINTLTALGNGFDIDADCRTPLLLGGGIGCAPLVQLAEALKEKGSAPTVILGFNTCADVVLEEEFKAMGVRTVICTADGSYGQRGFVTDAIRDLAIDGDYFFACGPTPMLRALCSALDIPGQLSLEARMGCGFGACMCCSVETKNEAKRICKDGPVFLKEELIWK